MRWVLGYLGAVCILVLIVCESVAIPTFLKPFYGWQFDRNDTANAISVEKDELLRVTSEMLDYMRGKRPDLDVVAKVGGVEREFFNRREKDHMADVRGLFDVGFRLRNISFWLLVLIILIMAFKKYRVVYFIARCGREIITAFLLLTFFIVVVIAVDFNRAFEFFHLVFFDNDLWILDPATDLLVNIVPTPFFISIAIFIGILAAALSLAFIIAATLHLRRVAVFERYPGAAAK